MPGGVELAQGHESLLEDILTTELSERRGAFWWMGQHTFIAKVGDKVIYIDPFFAPWESRQTPAPLRPEEARYADIVLVTHGHGDHLDPESLRAMVNASPKAQFFCPRTEEHRMREEAGIPEARINTLNAGQTWDADGIRITAIKAKHEMFDEHPTLGFPYLGYVIEIDGVTLYHAGDTIPYEGMITTLQKWAHYDVMFLPINGRDAERFLRGCLGNLTFQEAAELAGEFKPGLAVPAHYDMFLGNQEDPARFARFLEAKYPGVPHWIGKAGAKVGFGRGAGSGD